MNRVSFRPLSIRYLSYMLAVALIMMVPGSLYAQTVNALQATLGETEPTPDISTQEMRDILSDGSATILDSRSHAQFVAGHIPGAYNIDLPPGATDSQYSEAMKHLLVHLEGDKDRSLVLYCNGPHCSASRRLSKQLLEAGFTNVRRYQLGLPVWRSFGGPTVMELEGIVRIFKVDNTAVLFDVRASEEYASDGISGTHSLPLDEIASGVWDTAAKPRDDLNTRIVLFGRDGAQAREMAEFLATSPYHNVNYYPGTFESLKSAIDAELKARQKR